MSQKPDAAAGEPAFAPDTDGRERLHSRRALVAGVVGAGVGAAATLVTGAQPASADNGLPVILGAVNTASSTTSISTTGGTGLSGTTSDASGSGVTGVDASSSGGVGVQGTSTSGTGVAGTTLANNTPAVIGDATAGGGTGVAGISSSGTGVAGATSGPGQSAGVAGVTSGDGGFGVLGQDQSDGGAIGVFGVSISGTGVQATTHSGIALAVSGKVTFSSSGTATVPAHKNSVTVSQPGVSPSSLVLATLQQAQGSAAVAAAVPGTGSFTISLTNTAKTPLPVAWFVIG